MNFTHLNLKISHNLTIFKKSYSCIFFTQTNLIGEISLYVYHFLIFYKNTPVAGTLCQPKFRKKQCLTEALTKGRVFFFQEISKNLLHSALRVLQLWACSLITVIFSWMLFCISKQLLSFLGLRSPSFCLISSLSEREDGNREGRVKAQYSYKMPLLPMLLYQLADKKTEI